MEKSMDKKDMLKNLRLYEKLKTKCVNLKNYILFIKSCKKEVIIPTFAKVNLSIKSGDCKLKHKIAKSILDTELSKKHHQSGKFRKEIGSVKLELKSSLSLMEFNTVVHYIGRVIKSGSKSVINCHKKKLHKFCNNQDNYNELKRLTLSKVLFTTFQHMYGHFMKKQHLCMA